MAAANINPSTGLSTDYLNHFVEAVLLIELAEREPLCRDELMRWAPMDYRAYFVRSRLGHRALSIAAYEGASAITRRRFEAVCTAMHQTIEATRATFDAPPRSRKAVRLRAEAVATLKRLVGCARTIINGDDSQSPVRPPRRVRAAATAVRA